MSGESNLGIRVNQTGVNDAYSNLRKLHDELNRGSISISDYKKGLRENSTLLNSNTRLWNESKQAIYAANPTLLEFTRTMSGFGQVTAAASSGMTAINTAMLLMQGGTDQLNQLKIKLAGLTNQYDAMVAAGLGGTVQAQDLKNAMAQLNTEIGNENAQLWQKYAVEIISFGSAIGQIITSIPNIITLLKSLSLFTSGANAAMVAESGTAEALGVSLDLEATSASAAAAANTAVGLSADGAAASTGIFATAVKGLNTAIEASPFILTFLAALQAGSAAASGIQNLLGLGRLNPENSYQNYLQNAGIQTQQTPLDTLSNFISNPFGTIANALLPSGNLLPSASGEIQTQQLDTQKQTLNNQLQTYQELLTSNDNLVTISSNIDTTNSSLNSINTALTAGNQAKQDAVNSALSSLQSQSANITSQLAQLQQQNSTLQNQPQTQVLSYGQPGWQAAYVQQQSNLSDSFGEGNLTVQTDAAKQLAQNNQQIAQLQAQQQQLNSQAQNIVTNAATSGVLDVSSSGIQPVLASLGLDSSTGIGSIIAGALGGFGSGPGAAGLTANQLSDFAATGNYGIMSAQAILDSGLTGHITYDTAGNPISVTGITAAPSSTPNFTSRAQANAFTQAYGQSLVQAAQNLSSTTGMSFNNAVTAVTSHAEGGSFMTNGPHLMLVGEAGQEFVNITPMTNSRGGGAPNVYVYNSFGGSLLAENDFSNRVLDSLKTSLKRAGFT